MGQKPEKELKDKKKGPTIPAGTEQETGLTRGQTEKPVIRKSKKSGRENDPQIN
jgi:hypothetical protein